MAPAARLVLNDVCLAIVDCEHKTAPIQLDGHPSIRTPNIGRGRLMLEGVNRVSEETYALWTQRMEPRAGDLILAREAPIGNVAIVPSGLKVCLGQRTVLIRADRTKVLPEYLVYLMLGDEIQGRIRSQSNGATVHHLNMKDIRGLALPDVPSMDEQRRIASILSAYDDLIENNRRRIAILEEMARRIYEEWFVRFRFPGHEGVRMVESELGLVPEGWRATTLGDVLENVRVATRSGDHLSSRRYVPIDCIGRRSLALASFNSWTEAQSSLVLFEEDDILFGAMRAYFHKVCIAPFPGVTRTTCFVLRPRREELRSFATLMAFSDATVAYAAQHSQGATIPYAVWDGGLAQMAIAVPPSDLLGRFETAVGPMLSWLKGALLRQENLRTTRDLLLPKLISGELDVSTLPDPEDVVA